MHYVAFDLLRFLTNCEIHLFILREYYKLYFSLVKMSAGLFFSSTGSVLKK